MRLDFKAIYDNPAGTRTAIISRGRKNAKTTEAALMLLLHLCGPEARRNSQLNSTALSRDQAGIVYKLARQMVLLSPVLRRAVRPIDSSKQLVCDRLGTVFRALSADAATAVGLSPVFLVHDELGQVRGPKSDLYEACETATAANEQPLSVIISTQAAKDGDLLSILIDDAATGRDPSTVLRIDTAPIEADPFSERTIRKANPGLYSIMNRQEVLRMSEAAKALPSREAAYRNYVLNQRVEATDPIFPKAVWSGCGDAPAPMHEVRRLYVGLDLSAVTDLTAAVVVGLYDGAWQVWPTFWLPEDGLRDRAREDRVPYDIWHKQGLLETVPGRSIDYAFIAHWLRQLVETHDVARVAFDRWGFKMLSPRLLDAGFSQAEIDRLFVPFGQGFASMSPALQLLEADVVNGRMAHGNHPVLSMCIANTRVTRDPAGNRKLDKAKSTGRIDGAVALTMARGCVDEAEAAGKADPSFQLFFVGA